jgi:hypothetical protein
MREQGMFDPARLVFIDETCTTTSMVRLRGRCLRGERLIGYARHGQWKTITFVAGLRHRAMVAPFVFEGAINGPTILAGAGGFEPPHGRIKIWLQGRVHEAEIRSRDDCLFTTRRS